MKRFAIVILAVVMFGLFVSVAQAGDIKNLKAEDALLVKRIQGFNQLIIKANIRRAEIQGVLKWLAQKEAEVEAERIKAKKTDKEKLAEEKEAEPVE